MSSDVTEPTEEVKWASLALTHVEFPKDDLLGLILAMITMIPLCIIVGFITLILFRRDLHTICFFIGVPLNELINFGLKHIIKEERPCKDRTVLHVQYGMPSSHSQLMWFFTTYMTLFLFIRLPTGKKQFDRDSTWKVSTAIFLFLVSGTVCYSRIYLLYHTWQQIFYGAILGSFLGSGWFVLTHWVFSPFFPIVASWSISELFLIRDTTLIPNVMWFDYTSHRTESRTRMRKLSSKNS